MQRQHQRHRVRLFPDAMRQIPRGDLSRTATTTQPISTGGITTGGHQLATDHGLFIIGTLGEPTPVDTQTPQRQTDNVCPAVGRAQQGDGFVHHLLTLRIRQHIPDVVYLTVGSVVIDVRPPGTTGVGLDNASITHNHKRMIELGTRTQPNQPGIKPARTHTAVRARSGGRHASTS